MKKIGAIALFLLVLFGVVSCEISIWRECRQDHGWVYCMRTLHK